MKQTYLTLAFLITVVLSYSQSSNSGTISFDGYYIARTGHVEAANVDIYTYLRFYKDGSVYLQAVTENDPKAVSAWFGRFKRFSQKGTYQIQGTSVSINLNNKGSEDFKLEGLQETTYKGTIHSNVQMCLTRDNESKEFCFEFSKVADTTKLKYAKVKPEIKLPGEWEVIQILKGSRQVYFSNEDSTTVAIAVMEAPKLPFYKESQTDFESAYAFYEWESDYLKNEEDMDVKKILENKDKASIIWNVKDQYNDNNFLFAGYKGLLYNIMVSDENMPLEKQIKLLEKLYDINKD